jgi:hypothetical protein
MRLWFTRSRRQEDVSPGTRATELVTLDRVVLNDLSARDWFQVLQVSVIPARDWPVLRVVRRA